MRHLPVCATALLAACASMGAAAEQAIPSPWEARLLGGVAPGYDAGYAGVDQRIGTTGELVVLYRLPLAAAPLDLILGGGVFDDTRRGKADNPDNITQYDAQGIVLTGGVSYHLITHLNLEARAEVRAGEGRFSGQQTFANGNYEVLGNYGRYIAASAVVAAYYELPRAVSVGIEVGFDDFEGKSEYIDDTLSLRGDGLLVRVGLGYRF